MIIHKQLKQMINRSKVIRAVLFRIRIQRRHCKRVEKHISNRKKPIYYIIGYEDPQSSGWTVWERVVLYGAMYAEDHGLIPVVDMQNYNGIYQKKNDVGKVNVWEQYYLQPGRVSLEQAIASENYIIADTSMEWFNYIRMRPKRMETEYLRMKYQKYINLQPGIVKRFEERMKEIIPSYTGNEKIFTIKVRGTDYVQYQHSVQPEVTELVRLAKEKFEQYKCDFYYVSTEDITLLDQIKAELPQHKVITFNSGNVGKISGFVGEYLAETQGVEQASTDYLMTLYIINKSICLVGGVCGATLVAEYRRFPPYEYINIIDYNQHY